MSVLSLAIGGGFHEIRGANKTVLGTRGGRKRAGVCGEGQSGVEMVSEKPRRDLLGVCTHLRLILPFSDSWPSGSLLAASSEGGVDAESDSFFARATGMGGSPGGGVGEAGGEGGRGEVRQHYPVLYANMNEVVFVCYVRWADSTVNSVNKTIRKSNTANCQGRQDTTESLSVRSCTSRRLSLFL